MNYRVTKILAPEDLGSSGTKVISLAIRDIISRIEIMFKATNVDAGMSDHPAANLPTIELVDGSDVLFSASGKQAQAVDWYDRLKAVGNYISQEAGDPNRCVIGINFGRFLYDPLLALDPKKFTNPQLRITWDEDVANTSATTNECQVYAYVFDEKEVTPTGFLMTKQIYSYAPSADTYEYIDLPLDHIYRKILVQGLRKEQDPSGLLSEFRLSEDNDKRIPFDTTWTQEFYRHKREYGLYMENIQCSIPATSTKLYVTPAITQSIVGSLDTADLVLTTWSLDGGVITAESETAEHKARILLAGWLPHAVLCFPTGNQNEIEDWYDATKLGSLKLRIKAGSSAASTDTFYALIQQYRRYAAAAV